MDCGTPFCHWGCPIGNYIPEWNDLVTNQQWERAFEILNATNPMPEITGRVCPAHCEFACVLGINDDPVTIRENELAVIEHAFKKGWIVPRPPKKRTGKKVAVVGSGPAGLSAAAQLNKMGHSVTVFEQDDKIGGVLRYGIPDFKLEKKILDRRIDIWKKEGIKFKANTKADSRLVSEFDAVCLAIGCRTPRDLKIPGRELEGIHFAMDYLVQANKKTGLIDAKGKKVVIVGGGDTGADCVGTANRQGAKCVIQIEILPQPPECRDETCPWPGYPMLLKTTSSHEEGAERHWSILTKKFVGDKGKVKKLVCVKVDEKMKEIPGTEFEIEADLVILAIGFVKEKLDKEWENKKVFKAGDVQRGPSLVVWAIYEGREAAGRIDQFLKKEGKHG
jgi:glutamate synthase (NADPH/NADH) small chain